MRYLVLAADYDGTLAEDGAVAEATWEAVQRLRDSGRKLILVTGRELADLKRICPHLDRFERVVAENGGVLYIPASHHLKLLGPAPPAEFIQALRDRGVSPVEPGQTIVATVRPYETDVVQTIRDLSLELEVIFNKGSVMVLPPGVNKGTGMRAALMDAGLSPDNAVAVGDAENDLAFRGTCACLVAVANAIPALKKAADFTTAGEAGRGVIDLIDELLANDLRGREHR